MATSYYPNNTLPKLQNQALQAAKMQTKVRVVLYLILLQSLLGLPALAQDVTETKTNLADDYFTKAHEFSQKFKPDSAIIYFQLAAKQYLKTSPPDSGKSLVARTEMALELGRYGRFEQAYQLLDSIERKAMFEKRSEVAYKLYANYGNILEMEGRHFEAIDKADLAIEANYDTATEAGQVRHARLLYRKGFSLFQSRQFEAAMAPFEKSMAIFDAMNMQVNKALVLSQIGALKVQLLKADEALASFDVVKAIYENEAEGTQYERMGSLYINIGEAYRNLAMFREAANSLEESAYQFKQITPDHQALTIVYPQLGYTHNEMGDYETARQFYEEGLKLSLRYYGAANIRTVTNQMLLGKAYKALGRYDDALVVFKEASKILSTDLLGVAPDMLAMMVFETGFCYYKGGAIAKGAALLEQGVDMSMGEGVHLSRQTTNLSQILAGMYLDSGIPMSALRYYKRSLEVNAPWSAKDVSTPQTTYHFNRYASYFGLAASYEHLYHSEKEQSWLDSAYQMILLADDELTSLRKFPNRFSEQLEVNDRISQALDAGVRICHELFTLTGESRYAEQAFLLLEQSKSNQALFNFKTRAEAHTIPDSLLIKERSMNSALSSVETLLYNESQKEQPDANLLSLYKERLAGLTNALVAHSQYLRQFHAGYYQLRYDVRYVSIDEAKRRLRPSEMLINYHVEDEAIYAFFLTKDDFSFVKQALTPDILPVIKSFLQGLERPVFGEAAVSNYAEQAIQLSRLLLPANELIPGVNSLVIIPDGLLHQLPFGALLADSTQVEVNKGFQPLPYLIKEFKIKYATSATMLSRQMERHTRFETSDQVLAFSPSFDEATQLPARTIDTLRAGLGALVHSKFEVDKIRKHFSTALYSDSLATERNFKALAAGFPVVHIASHGLINEQNGLYSRIVFSPFDTDSISDGFLNTREILGMQIPAKLVVLSACNSGSGQVYSGEGVMSLANGFFYAGAKSLVMTLWTANDQSTAEVVGAFYEALSSGESKSSALKQAKLNYLANANRLSAHPYYWAHLVVNGDDSPIVKGEFAWYYLVVGMVLFGIIGWAFLRKRIQA